MTIAQMTSPTHVVDHCVIYIILCWLLSAWFMVVIINMIKMETHIQRGHSIHRYLFIFIFITSI